MADQRESFSFAKWVPGFLFRFIVWNASVVSIARGYSWLLGYDDEFKVWAVEHRGDLLIVIILGSVMYGMMDWMRSQEP